MEGQTMDRRALLGAAATTAASAVARRIARAAPVAGGTAALTEGLTEAMAGARQAALDLLRPSRKQLQHGLALHADAIVFDAYGFSPTAAVDGALIAKAVTTGAAPLEIDDLLEDGSMTRHIDDET